jgi:uracil-DNA glycosylase
MTKISGAIVFDGIDKSFSKILLSKVNRPLIVSALNLINGNNISPKQDDILAFAKYSADDVKIVIIGQEPHQNPEHAHGYAFSSLGEKIPSSLMSIYDALLTAKLIDKIPTSANLISWVRQGVLLLNVALTTEVGKVGAHIQHWKPLTSAIVSYFGSLDRPICFMLRGDYAMKMRSLIKNGLVLDCNDFSGVNNYLLRNGISPIDWNVDGHVELRISVKSSGGTKYTKKIVAHCEVFMNEKLIANLSEIVSAEIDFSGGQIHFPTTEKGFECAKKLGLSFVKTIGYLTIEIKRSE